jgi:hypothetical protein
LRMRRRREQRRRRNGNCENFDRVHLIHHLYAWNQMLNPSCRQVYP